MAYAKTGLVHTVRIPSGNSRQTGWVDRGLLRLVAIGMPSGWTTASITFLATARLDADPRVWDPVYKADGAELEVMVSGSRTIVLDPADYCGLSFFRIRSGTQATPVNQTDARDIELILRPV